MPANQTAPPPSSSVPSKCKMIISNPDGTFTRLIQFPNVAATADHSSPSPVLSKDIPINPTNQTWLRIFVPKHSLNSSNPNRPKLPIIFYFHGGAFVYLSAATDMNHNFCAQLAEQLVAVVISVEYRLAPEHRLPAPYHDAEDALHCIKNCNEVWLRQCGDFSNCYLMGTSAGANIAYHAGLRALEGVDDLEPLKIRGMILHQPFLGGVERTGSELRNINDPILTVNGCDLMWELALPGGANRDHEYCNPTAGSWHDRFDRIREMGWRVLVTGRYGDPLMDRQMELFKTLERTGVRTVGYFDEGYHGMELSEPSKADDLLNVINQFLL